MKGVRRIGEEHAVDQFILIHQNMKDAGLICPGTKIPESALVTTG